MSAQWTDRKEAGGKRALRFILWLAMHTDRKVAHLTLYPITLYFLIVRGVERRASRNFLRRALGREPSIIDVARHIHTFAATILDRVYLLSGRFDPKHIRMHGLEDIEACLDRGKGVLLLGSHLGSFEVVRVVGLSRPNLLVRVLMDYGHNRQLAAILDTLNPRVAESLIDAADDSTRVLLRMHETLEAGGLVGMLGDRIHSGEAAVQCEFFGEPVRFPTSPLRIASVLKVPVMLIFGVLRPNGEYDVYFENFAERIALPRDQREQQAREWIQRYAQRLEHFAREAPFNWFNFYDFWNDEEQG